MKSNKFGTKKQHFFYIDLLLYLRNFAVRLTILIVVNSHKRRKKVAKKKIRLKEKLCNWNSARITIEISFKSRFNHFRNEIFWLSDVIFNIYKALSFPITPSRELQFNLKIHFFFEGFFAFIKNFLCKYFCSLYISTYTYIYKNLQLLGKLFE